MRTVTLYTQPSCGPCHGVKRWLKANGVDFTEVNVRTEPGAAEAIQALGYTGTPVTIVNHGDGSGDLHLGEFNPDLLARFILNEEAA